MNLRKPDIRYFAICVVAFTLSLMPGTSALAGAKVFDMVTLGNDGSLPQGHYSGDNSKVTPDGRYVVFRSGESKLVTPNTSGYQIFLRDRWNGTTELISTDNGGTAFGNGSSDYATISDDGCRVVFMSDSTNLVAGYQSRSNNSNVYLRERCKGPFTTSLVSVNYNGAQANAASYAPAISGNGQYVAFNSYATDLVQGVTNTDVLYRRDLEAQTTILLSVNIHDGTGVQADYPALSYDGSRIAFTSASQNLVSQTVYGWNVFLYDANANPLVCYVKQFHKGFEER